MESENPWVRRAAAVTFIYGLRRDTFLQHAFEVADELLTDEQRVIFTHINLDIVMDLLMPKGTLEENHTKATRKARVGGLRYRPQTPFFGVRSLL